MHRSVGCGLRRRVTFRSRVKGGLWFLCPGPALPAGQSLAEQEACSEGSSWLLVLRLTLGGLVGGNFSSDIPHRNGQPAHLPPPLSVVQTWG